ncbi:hypothetical protein L6452_27187 [Arctium lappa]|uniref:Uncharacterized protein n=1 Tax=Arctium lappa TaxID=4217 RepID=A0ACB8ZVF9_ARCLA|nr:hypothetical protein L6452_27187 [Arctium lappa]
MKNKKSKPIPSIQPRPFTVIHMPRIFLFSILCSHTHPPSNQTNPHQFNSLVLSAAVADELFVFFFPFTLDCI